MINTYDNDPNDDRPGGHNRDSTSARDLGLLHFQQQQVAKQQNQQQQHGSGKSPSVFHNLLSARDLAIPPGPHGGGAPYAASASSASSSGRSLGDKLRAAHGGGGGGAHRHHRDGHVDRYGPHDVPIEEQPRHTTLKNSGITIDFFGDRFDVDDPHRPGGHTNRSIRAPEFLEPYWGYLPTNRRRAVYWLVACAVIVGVAFSGHGANEAPPASSDSGPSHPSSGAGAGGSTTIHGPNSDSPSPPTTPTDSHPVTPQQQSRFDAIRDRIQGDGLTTNDDLLKQHDAHGDSANKSPQLLAMEWLAVHDERQVDVEDEYLLERYALAVFWYSTYEFARLEDIANPPNPDEPNADNAHNWLHQTNWMTGKGICSWFGVQCHHFGINNAQTRYDHDGIVTHVNVTSNAVRGTVPPEFWEILVDIRVLDLSDNLINGTVSDEIGKWEDLETIYLNQNFFAGTVPTTLFNPQHESKLEILDLGNNFLESTVPNNIGRLYNLKKLALYDNWLTGTVPLSLSELKRLQFLYLDGNGLTGTVPLELARLEELTDLRLRDNELEGKIPEELGTLDLLEILYLDTNKLTGEIPTKLGELERLEELHLYKNKLSGNLPSQLGKLRYLQLIYLDSNQFDGPIPDSFGSLHDIQQLYLYGNRLTGTIPNDIYEIEDIEELRLNDNELTGILPSEIGQLLHLTTLHIENNNFHGTLPTEMGRMFELTALRVQDTDLVGPVPDDICLLRDGSLNEFVSDCDEIKCKCCTDCFTRTHGSGQTAQDDAGAHAPQQTEKPDNGDDGTSNEKVDETRFGLIRQRIIDAGISTVEDLDATPDNTWHGSPQHQAVTWLSDRDQRNMDPNDEASLPHLLERYALAVFYYATYEVSNWLVKDNWMTGEGICSWYGIVCAQDADLVSENVDDEVTYDGTVIQFNLTSNSLGGEVPDEIWKVLTNVQVLVMAKNGLSGSIDADIGKWSDLEILDLGSNSFGHQLPNEIGNLNKLDRLELYENQFTGTIPSSISNCKMIDVIYLDGNDLTGEIPVELTELVQMTDLRLRSNHLHGTMAPAFGDLKELKILYLDDNDLTGPIPSEFGNLMRLEELHLYKNKLSGNLPSELGNLRYLTLLYLDSNEIEGSIPDTFGGLHDLTQLFLFGNKLTGSIPHTMYGIENVEELRLNDNTLDGTLPPEIGQLLRLRNFHVENNNIQGFLPNEMSKMYELEVLRIQKNAFIGTVPNGICLLRDQSLDEFVSDCKSIDCQCCTECP